jgi:zinc transport system permease protein
MGAALYLNKVHGLVWLQPLHGAVVAALLAALIIGVVTLRSRERADTIIGALWAIGMALGVLFISLTPGYAEDLMSYLFGNILFVSSTDLLLLLILDLVVVALGVLFYNQLVAICFDEEFARLRGVRVELHYLLLLALTALTVVLLTTVVGIILVIALLTLPAATAGRFTRNLWQMIVAATVLCALFCVSGLWISYAPSLPAGAVIIVIAGAVYLIAALGRGMLRRLRREVDGG